ncbi:MAG: hypothetical protein WKF66_16640 [Pedobacter sp.]
MKLYSTIWLTLIIPIATRLTFQSEPVVREILTSQQLFVTILMPLTGKYKKTRQGYEARLQDAFKVIKYEDDSTYVELDWTLCPNGNCPEIGQFKEGTSNYKQIDSLIRSIYNNRAIIDSH